MLRKIKRFLRYLRNYSDLKKFKVGSKHILRLSKYAFTVTIADQFYTIDGELWVRYTYIGFDGNGIAMELEEGDTIKNIKKKLTKINENDTFNIGEYK